MTEQKVIFLDLDGVLIDFIGGVAKWYDLDITDKDVTGWDSIVGLSGKTLVEFWEGLDDREFWYNLEMYDYAPRVLEIVERCEAIPCLLTSPAWHTAGHKQDWIQDNLPDYFSRGRYLIGPAKGYCSYPGAWLIDDSDANCKFFREFGGDSILFPQPWNDGRGVTMDKANYLGHQLIINDLLIDDPVLKAS